MKTGKPGHPSLKTDEGQGGEEPLSDCASVSIAIEKHRVHFARLSPPSSLGGTTSTNELAIRSASGISAARAHVLTVMADWLAGRAESTLALTEGGRFDHLGCSGRDS